MLTTTVSLSSESYLGYMQCMYSLNNAHTKFGKLYKTVFPNGLPSTDPISPSKTSHLKTVSHQPSISSPASASSKASAATTTGPSKALHPPRSGGSFFSRWMGSSAIASTPILPIEQGASDDGPVEDLIVAGTAFGFGLFNLVFSLLPKKIQGVVGLFGFKSDRKLALQALALSASKDDVHGVFAGLVLMTYHGVVLLLSGYQSDEKRLLKEYKAIVDKIEKRYPEGALWILNRAKIMRMAYDAEGAIEVLKEGLKADRKHSFVQADMLLMFELSWTLLSQRRYQEAAEAFMKITEMNSWSHGTYYFIAAGCYISLGNVAKAQELLDAIPELIDKKKMTGKDLPTEVFIKKKLAFYKEKQARRGGDPKKWAECIKISPAEEIGIFWNNHSRISPAIAKQHVDELVKLSPVPVVEPTPLSPTTSFKSAKGGSLKSPILEGLRSLSRRSSSFDVERAGVSPTAETPKDETEKATLCNGLH
ncbi:hypothetical protein CVT24_002376 [Panaeolus cyanescens]|uniref:Uncharacterized protein n=1 Tax=Panaeolus cyanescens TaxID=181874 RepID=A0A409X006_9AGAR|nr:hypothetical protein CVT24_002376 [Panaeolus cyanescens]